jgi:hypothetical protein
MRNLDFGRYMLSRCMAAALLAGCGGSQPPIGAPGATAQVKGESLQRPARLGSWMKPGTSGQDLLYVVNQVDQSVNGVRPGADPSAP